MKIQAIRKMLLSARRCDILTGQRGQQWIGTNRAIFRVDEGLKIGPESIQGLFDFDTGQMDKIEINEMALEEASIWPLAGVTQNRMAVCQLGINNCGGVELLSCDGRMYLCSMAAIKAAVDSADYREYYLGRGRHHAPLIIVNDGMIFSGVIRPQGIEECRFILRQMEDWGQLLAAGWAGEAASDEETEEESQQMRMA